MGAHWAARGAVGSGRCHGAGSWSARGEGTGPGLGQGRGTGVPRARRAPGPAYRERRWGGRGVGAGPGPPRSRPGRARPAPAPLRARSLPVVRALGRCQRGAPEEGRSAARGVWFRRGCEGGGELWPWGSPSSTGGSRSGIPASARCWRSIRWAGSEAALPDTGRPRGGPDRPLGGMRERDERPGLVPGRPCGTESLPGPARPQPGRRRGAAAAQRLKVVGRRWAIAGERARRSVPPDSPCVRAETPLAGSSARSPRLGAGGAFGSPGPGVPRSPGEWPARGWSRPAAAPPGSRPSLWVPSAAPRCCLSTRGEPEVGVCSLLGSEKLQLLTANGAVMTRGRFYSSAAFPCCCPRRTVCVRSWTGKYVQAWETKAVNQTSNSWTKTSSFQRYHIWYLLDTSASNYHFQLVSQMWFYRLNKDVLR